MRAVIAALATALLALNVAYYVTGPWEEQGPSVENENHGSASDIESLPENFTLKVPDYRIGDRAVYAYTVRAYMYWENRTSGEWERYTLVGEGTLVQIVEGIVEVEDGFKETHRALAVTEDTEATFTLTIEGSDKDPQTIPGSISAIHTGYRDLYNGRIVKNYNEGSIRVDTIPRVKIPVNYSGWMRNYPNLKEPEVSSLDESIYGDGRSIKVGDTGTYTAKVEGSEFEQTYYWRAVRSGKLYGFRSMQINVTSSFFGFLNFNRSFWISENSPFVLKGRTRTNQTFMGEEETFIIDLTTTRDIEEARNLREGTEEVVWGSCPGRHYYSRSPGGEFKPWDLAPDDGSDSSTVDVFPLSEAIELALNRSGGLREFMEEYTPQKTFLTGAMFNWTEDTITRNTTYMWNLTFGYAASDEEYREAYQATGETPEFAYNILVAKTEMRNFAGDVTEIKRYVLQELGRVGGRAPMGRVEVGEELLTVSAAERLLKSDRQVRGEVYSSGGLQEGFRFFYVMGSVGYTSNPSLVLVSSLTGLTPPTSKLSYLVQSDTLYASGNTFSAGIDAQTGQLLYVMKVEGTDLQSIFGGG